MTGRLSWGDTGTRFYEGGISKGVLYPHSSGIGVPWNGLTAVDEKPAGADQQAYYVDGIKYIQFTQSEEYAATIEAFSSPPEFNECDGTGNIYQGLFITQQPRRQFDFAYVTQKGNDLQGLDYGYKIHLVYNALAKPSSRNNETTNDSPDANSLSWDITTLPPITYGAPGFKPSAHIVIDSVLTGSEKLQAIENMLYGHDEEGSSASPFMPSQADVVTLFTRWDYKGIVPDTVNGLAELIFNGGDLQSTQTPGLFSAQSGTRLTATATAGLFTLSS